MTKQQIKEKLNSIHLGDEKNIFGFAVVCYYNRSYQKTYTIHRFGVGISDATLEEAIEYLYKKIQFL